MDAKLNHFICRNETEDTMLLHITSHVQRFQHSNTVDAPFIAIDLLKHLKAVGHVYVRDLSYTSAPFICITLLSLNVCVSVTGGKLDWTAIGPAVNRKYELILFLHCVTQIGLLVMNGNGKLPLMTSLVEQAIDF